MRTTAKIIVAGVSTLALAGGVGAGLAYADPADPTPTPTTTTTASPTPADKKAKARDGARKHRGLLASALHGEVTLAGKQHRVVLFQRGPVEKVSGTELTVKSADGYSATYRIATDTKVRKNGDAAAAGDLQADDRVHVVAVRDGSTLKALRIRARD
jgi:hypothetical protein